jgi:hypothetical protein
MSFFLYPFYALKFLFPKSAVPVYSVTVQVVTSLGFRARLVASKVTDPFRQKNI